MHGNPSKLVNVCEITWFDNCNNHQNSLTKCNKDINCLDRYKVPSYYTDANNDNCQPNSNDESHHHYDQIAHNRLATCLHMSLSNDLHSTAFPLNIVN